MVRSRLTCWLLLAFLPLMARASGGAGAVDFDREVRPIFVEHCLACHGGVKQSAGLSVVAREGALAAIEPGDAEASQLVERIADPDDESRMPPAEHGRRLSDAEVGTIRRWIDEGADWPPAWAYRAPASPATPEAGDDWARSSVDRFVLRKLNEEALRPSPEADRAAWLRRVSFDLTGLPPSGSLRDAFRADESPEAYERVVDELLASPHFGERWASVWLDLVRYGDTMGYQKDLHRDIWPYRDWVIRAFDANKPYDEFLVEQLAGDLLPEATLADRVATAMHRNTPTNIEGGTDDEEFRVAAVVDRVDTTWQAIGGLTFGCARCHDHPYEPITHADYYRFLASFNSTQDADLHEEFPRLAVPDDHADWERAGRLDREIAALSDSHQRLTAELAAGAVWRGVAFDAARSTGLTEMSLRPVEGSINGSARDGVEVLAGGTITNKSLFTVRGPAPPGRLTSIRIDVLPSDLEEALRNPEMGFVLARLRAFVERGGSDHEIFFRAAYCDDRAAFFRPAESLRDNTVGWSAYSRLLRPRWTVFVVDDAIDGSVELVEGDRLRLELKHGQAQDDLGTHVVRRLRVAVTDDPRWARIGDAARPSEGKRGLDELRQARRAIPCTTIPVMAERPSGHERPTHRFERGNWLVKAERLDAGPPEVFGDSWHAATSPRLAMARWIASPDHPLTARVWANRVWAELFGEGIVATLDDFGVTGAEPSHPELLDCLATRLTGEWGWRLKPMLRELVLSATYRQDAHVSDELLKRDPRNRLLARGPRGRLRAEMIRDQALVLSGRFNPERFGPPVMPYQPEGIWRSIHNAEEWVNAEDESRFRRAVYTFLKKTAAYPSLAAFDAPSRDRCVARRGTTNTPLQALVTMNDPAFFELAEGLAERMLARDEPLEERIAWAYREATGAAPSGASLSALIELCGAGAESGVDPDETVRREMTIVASAILNLDATLTK